MKTKILLWSFVSVLTVEVAGSVLGQAVDPDPPLAEPQVIELTNGLCSEQRGSLNTTTEVIADVLSRSLRTQQKRELSFNSFA